MSDLLPDERAAAGAPAFGVRRLEPDELRYRPFLPLLLLVLAGLTWFAFQCYQLVREKEALAMAYANQTQKFEDSGKMRSALDGIARDTATLASKGNPSAKLVVDELARRGVAIGSPPPAAAAPK